ncbi:MAG: DUF4157 domain-containing protein [Cyanobacteria bacterium SBLK]|nr:DUF4157 domain-containing protein [Cyanobacteria bacterium SBLK]
MPSLQRDGTGEATVSSEVETQIDRARGGGQPLDNKVKESMGGAMGANFEGVKVHTDGTANRLNQQLHSRAFTTGPDVFFKRGEYRPGSTEGDRLIAHELTHVVQQGEGVQKKDACIQRSPLKPGYLNIVGENHDETGAREGFENKFLKFFLSEHEDAKSFGWGGIKTEGDAAYYSQNKNDEETEEYNNDNNEEYDDEEDENLVKLQVDSSYYRGLQGLVSGVSSALELKEMAQKDFDRISQLDEKQAITTIQEIYGMYERQCEIIIASLRDARELESVSQDYDDDWNLKTIRKMKSAELDRVGIKSKALQQTIANLMVEIEGLENQYQTILSSLNKFLPQKIDSNDENSQKASNASNDEMKSTRDRFKEIEMLCEKYAWETYRTVQKYCKPTALSQDSGSNNEELLISDIAHKSALEFYVKKDAVSDEVSFIRSEIMLDSVKKYQKQDLGSLGKVSEVYKVGNDHIKEMSIYMREVLIYAQEDNPSTELDNLKINLVSRDEFNWQLMDWAFKTNYWKNEDGWKKMVETVKNKSLHKKILQPFGPDWIEENLNEIISEYGADRDFLTWLGITNDILINK